MIFTILRGFETLRDLELRHAAVPIYIQHTFTIGLRPRGIAAHVWEQIRSQEELGASLHKIIKDTKVTFPSVHMIMFMKMQQGKQQKQ